MTETISVNSLHLSADINIIPEGACDSHVHFYGPLEQYPPPAISKYVIPNARPENFFSIQHAAGITRAVVVNAAAASPDNRRTLDALIEYPDQLRGIITMPPTMPTDKELYQWDALGVRGLRLSYVGSHVQPFHESFIARIAELGWHVQVQIENQQIMALQPLLKGLPCDIVIDHMGRIPAISGIHSKPFQCLLGMLSSGRTWIKLSAPMRYSSEAAAPYRDVQPMAQALVNECPDRMLWGSDWPHVNYKGTIPAYSTLLKLLNDWVPNASIRNKVLADNPAKLYGF